MASLPCATHHHDGCELAECDCRCHDVSQVVTSNGAVVEVTKIPGGFAYQIVNTPTMEEA